jgi:hypothetical protein
MKPVPPVMSTCIRAVEGIARGVGARDGPAQVLEN